MLYSCAGDRYIGRKMNKTFKESTVLAQHHVGFALAATDAKKLIYQQQADHYFTPASNMKLLNFYAALKLIPDSVPGLRYIIKGDSLIFWGTGDPSFLQSRLRATRTYDFLRTASQQLFFSDGRYTGNVYGQGWAWDDYNDYYQAEINELPLMDNLLQLNEKNGSLSVFPRLFVNCVRVDSLSAVKSFKVFRDVERNEFSYPALAVPKGYTQEIPYKTGTALTLSLLSDTLHRPVQLVHIKMDSTAKTIYNAKTDDVLREMMLPSDDFIAEQLLLVYANQLRQDLNGAEAIAVIRKKYFSDLPDQPNWIDGSGLSRMNLITPRDMIRVLSMIYAEIGAEDRLFAMLPAGGKSGTLKNAYPATERPFVFGKTGSFSNNYNQSGYIVTKKGRTLLFSFMNNNYVLPTATVKQEIARIVTYIHDTF